MLTGGLAASRRLRGLTKIGDRRLVSPSGSLLGASRSPQCSLLRRLRGHTSCSKRTDMLQVRFWLLGFGPCAVRWCANLQKLRPGIAASSARLLTRHCTNRHLAIATLCSRAHLIFRIRDLRRLWEILFPWRGTDDGQNGSDCKRQEPGIPSRRLTPSIARHSTTPECHSVCLDGMEI